MSAANTPGQAPRETVSFLLDGQRHDIANVDPGRTVLQFLREDLCRTGTKEGCAEGDCGACTVVVADLDESGERLDARAVNACIQFLPTLDGKALYTVESLADDGLHPIQQALVDCHGSQCGFCTPGFVMSLFALYKSSAAPTRRDIDDALAGNLCRCTGYAPIIKAAREMYQAASGERWTHRPAGGSRTADEEQQLAALRSLNAELPLSVTTNGRSFYAPLTAKQLADLLSAHPGATVLAGGTDIGLWVTKQHRELDTLVYTGRVAELQLVQESASHLEIGAAVSLSDAMPLIIRHFPAFKEVLLRFASPPIRNAGTLGGNVANGSPIGDSMPLLLAADAELVLRRGNNMRTLPLHEFYIAYQETALQAGEFIERIRLPLPASAHQFAAYKVSKRFDQDISAVCAGLMLRRAGDIVEDVRIAFGGMAEIPRRAEHCEESLRGSVWNEQTVAQAATMLEKDFTPISDLRSSANYRMQVCKNLLLRFFHEDNGEAPVRVYDYGR